MERAQKLQRAKESGQHGLFGGGSATGRASAAGNSAGSRQNGRSTKFSPPNIRRSAFIFPATRSINMPGGLQDLNAIELSTMEGRRNNEEIVVAGIIVQARPMRSRRGARWAILTLQDRTGVIEALVFPEAFQKLEPILKPRRRCS